MIKKSKFKLNITLSVILSLSQFSCTTIPNSDIKPSSSSQPTNNNTIIQNPSKPVQNPSNNNAPPSTDIPTGVPANIVFNSVNFKEGSIGSQITITGKNFITGKVKSVTFLNNSGHSTTASIKSVSEENIVFEVPSKTELNLSSDNIITLNDQRFHNAKIYLNLENDQKVFISDFKVIIQFISNSNSSGGSFGGGSSSGGSSSGDTGTVTPKDAGTIAGVIKNVDDETALSNATVKLYKLDDTSTFKTLANSTPPTATAITRADGSFSIIAENGNKYYLEVEKDGYSVFYYQGVKVTKDEINTLGETLYLTKKEKGKAELKGNIKDASNNSILEGSILKVYNNRGFLINTGISVTNGIYSFDVPSGTNYFIEVIREGYNPFRYYGVNISNGVVSNLEDIYQSINTVERKTFTGKIKDVLTKNIIDSSVIKIYRDKKLISTGIANGEGTYSFLAPYYSDSFYHLTVVKDTYINFTYYGINISTVNITIEDLYLTLSSVGTSKVNGKITATTTSDINSSVVRIYNSSGLLIMTGLSSIDGTYDFFVPVGENYWFEVVKSGYTTFRYYSLNILKDKLNTIETIFLTLSSLGTTTVSGTLLDTDNKTIANGLVRIYNSDGYLVMTYLANTEGIYNFHVPVGTNYYMRVIHNLYTDFYYYGINLVKDVNYIVEKFYLTLASVGVGTVKGNVDLTSMPVGTVLRIYNKAGLLIMTTRVGIGGAYNFFVPVGVDYYFRVIRSGYTDFYYYGINVVLNKIFTVSEVFKIYLSSVGTGVFTGVYVDADGNPIANTIVRIYSGSYVIASGFTDANGYYYIRVPSGVSYTYRYWYYYGGIYRYYYTYTGLAIYNGVTYYSPYVYYISPELEGKGNVSGTIIEAVSAERVKNLTLKLRSGVNNTTGDILATKISGDKGFYSFDNIDAGNYTIEVSGTGYVTTYYNILALGNRTLSDRNIIISKTLEAGQKRIVLYWSSRPSDLDIHLTGPNSDESRFHVNYNNKGSSIAEPFATLDRDSFGGYGPEVITIHKQLPGTYRFSVHNFSDQTATSENKSYNLSYSYARVYVYNDNGTVNYFYVPYNPNGGNLWTVFEMTNGVITPVNEMSYINSGMSIKSFSNGNDAPLIKSLPRKR